MRQERLRMIGFWMIALYLGTRPGATVAPIPNSPDPAAVQEVMSGQRAEADAAWWGFNPEDVTESLQAALDSGAKRLTIPFMGADWIVRPLTLRSNQEVVFEPGVVVLAKKDEFKATGDSLFSASNASNITLRGYGATLRMRHQDYMTKAYKKGEWRMTLDFDGCRKITVEGLRLESSGGDGIYLGATSELPWCEDVLIRNVVCDDHHRQGISVIGAVNLLIENCILSNTGGTAPQAGIDFEPNQAREKLVNCVMRNCTLANNRGAGILLYLKNLSKESEPVSLLFENCLVAGGADCGIGVGMLDDDGPQGSIEFRNCIIDGPARAGAYLYDKSASSARLRFVNCHWRNTWNGSSGKKNVRVPLLIHRRRPEAVEVLGGIDFVDCHVYDTEDRAVLLVENEKAAVSVRDLAGRLVVHNPYGGRMDLGPHPEAVDLRLEPAVQ